MKFLGVAMWGVLALTFLGCGGNGSESVSGDRHATTTTVAAKEERKPGPHLVPPKGPPPKNLVVKNLKVGPGPVAHRGDRVAIKYVAFDYETGEEPYWRWGPSAPPLSMRLGADKYSRGLDEGVEGMRVGGRRELTIPSHLAFDEGAIIYVVELVSVKAANAGAGE
jgi:peptidylprolyl isomerase